MSAKSNQPCGKARCSVCSAIDRPDSALRSASVHLAVVRCHGTEQFKRVNAMKRFIAFASIAGLLPMAACATTAATGYQSVPEDDYRISVEIPLEDGELGDERILRIDELLDERTEFDAGDFQLDEVVLIARSQGVAGAPDVAGSAELLVLEWRSGEYDIPVGADGDWYEVRIPAPEDDPGRRLVARPQRRRNRGLPRGRNGTAPAGGCGEGCAHAYGLSNSGRPSVCPSDVLGLQPGPLLRLSLLRRPCGRIVTSPAFGITATTISVSAPNTIASATTAGHVSTRCIGEIAIAPTGDAIAMVTIRLHGGCRMRAIRAHRARYSELKRSNVRLRNFHPQTEVTRSVDVPQPRGRDAKTRYEEAKRTHPRLRQFHRNSNAAGPQDASASANAAARPSAPARQPTRHRATAACNDRGSKSAATRHQQRPGARQRLWRSPPGVAVGTPNERRTAAHTDAAQRRNAEPVWHSGQCPDSGA